MSKKNNIRSFRFSDEVAKILFDFEGNSVNEKFENLVLYCYKKSKAVKKEIEKYQAYINDMQKEIASLTVQRNDILNELINYRDISSNFSAIRMKLFDIKENLEKNVTQ